MGTVRPVVFRARLEHDRLFGKPPLRRVDNFGFLRTEQDLINHGSTETSQV